MYSMANFKAMNSMMIGAFSASLMLSGDDEGTLMDHAVRRSLGLSM